MCIVTGSYYAHCNSPSDLGLCKFVYFHKDQAFGAGIIFLNFSTSCIQNVHNTGTKQVSIVKQTAF